MFGIDELTSFVNVTIVLVCFLLGYLIKHYTKINNKNIPLIMIITGIVISILLCVINKTHIDLHTILSGALSGLASSGSKEFLSQTFGVGSSDKEETTEEEYTDNIEDDSNNDY